MSVIVNVHPSYVSVIDDTAPSKQNFEICDDCGEAYLEPAYYTFPPEACTEGDDDGGMQPHQGCTGNCCPDCVSMSLPDDPQDPRASPEVRQQAKDSGYG